jgi:hypothetical protein
MVYHQILKQYHVFRYSNHKFRFKVGCPVMLMMNIDQVIELCNETRLIVDNLGKNFIGATVITEKNAGEI